MLVSKDISIVVASEQDLAENLIVLAFVYAVKRFSATA